MNCRSMMCVCTWKFWEEKKPEVNWVDSEKDNFPWWMNSFYLKSEQCRICYLRYHSENYTHIVVSKNELTLFEYCNSENKFKEDMFKVNTYIQTILRIKFVWISPTTTCVILCKLLKACRPLLIPISLNLL